jgi:AraC-like DNA-binding protein
MKHTHLTYPASIFTIVILLISALSINWETLNIIENDQYYIEGYSDIDAGGNSIVQLESNQPISYSYQVNDKIQFPYAGIYFEDTLDRKRIDLSDYNQVKISIKSLKGKQIPITINSIWNLKNRPYQKLLKVSSEQSTFLIPFAEFKTPEWWLNQNKIIDDNHQNFKKIKTINIENCKLLAAGINDEISITKIEFSTNNISNYILIISLWVTGLFFIFLFYYFKKSKKIVPIKSVDFNPKNQTDSKTLVVSYIGNNYTNSKLSIQDISNETNIKSSQVSKVLMLHFSTTFKEYLNYIRISEAKKLLTESDLNISEISYSVGYNNVTHFNRVFKTKENISPNEFRSK